MNAAWRIKPEPTEEELAALMTAIMASLQSNSARPPEPEPPSRWLRAARRDAIDAGIETDRG